MPPKSSKRSSAFSYFELQEDYFICTVENDEGERCGQKISAKVGQSQNVPTRCFNLKRHLERTHAPVYNKVLKEDKEEEKLPVKKSAHESHESAAGHSRQQQRISAYVATDVIKVKMTKDKFEQGLVEMVAYGAVPLTFFSSTGFVRINGELAKQLNVKLDKESVRALVINTAEREREEIIQNLQGKFVYVKVDACTRLRANYLGVNVQFFDEKEEKVVVKTLGVKDTENKHTSEAISKMLQLIFSRFNIDKEQILCCVVDNASNMTKTVQRLNEEEWQGTDEDEEEGEVELNETKDDEDGDGDLALLVEDLSTSTTIHHMRCAVHTLQLAIRDGLKGQIKNFLAKIRAVVTALRTPHLDAIVRKKSQNKKGAIIDQTTRWGSTYLMISRLVELKAIVQDLGDKDVYLSEAQWEEVEGLKRLLGWPYKTTLKLQSNNLTPGKLYYDWHSLMFQLKAIGGPVAEAIVSSMDIRAKQLLENDLLLAGIFVDSRSRVLLSAEECQRARLALMTIHRRLQGNTSELSALEEPEVEAEAHPSSASDDENEFEQELCRRVQQQQQQSKADSKSEAAFNASLDAMVDLGRLKGKDVWEIISKYPASIRQICQVVFALPPTQALVERLFSSLKILRSDLHSSMKEDLLDAILFLRINRD